MMCCSALGRQCTRAQRLIDVPCKTRYFLLPNAAQPLPHLSSVCIRTKKFVYRCVSGHTTRQRNLTSNSWPVIFFFLPFLGRRCPFWGIFSIDTSSHTEAQSFTSPPMHTYPYPPMGTPASVGSGTCPSTLPPLPLPQVHPRGV